MTVTGSYWAQALSQRLGYGVSNGEPYSLPGCTLTSDCVFPGGVIPQSAFAKRRRRNPAVYSVAESGSRYGSLLQRQPEQHRQDDKIGQRVDFINQKTGNWSVLLSLRRFDRVQRAARRQRAGLS